MKTILKGLAVGCLLTAGLCDRGHEGLMLTLMVVGLSIYGICVWHDAIVAKREEYEARRKYLNSRSFGH